MRPFARIAAVGGLCLAAAAAARADAPAAQDRAAVEACLKRVAEHVAAAARSPATGPTDPASCIGVVAEVCQQEPGGGSTYGMIDCNRRELAVWEERLDHFYRAAVKRGGKLAAAIRRAERAFIALREAKCALPAIEEAGGSAVGPLTTSCLLKETARQAIWLGGTDTIPSTAPPGPGRP